MKVILTGPPGAGKGTMSRYIEEEFEIPIISTGEILRREIRNNTELGLTAKELIEKGSLVPDQIVINIIKNHTKDMKNGYLLDGFPRNKSQALAFDKMLEENDTKIDIVINIDVSDEILIDRVKGRLVCPNCSRSYHVLYAKPKNTGYCDACNSKLEKRKDDTEENARHRLEIYHHETKPLLEYYQEKGLLININSGFDDIKETHYKLREIMKSLTH